MSPPKPSPSRKFDPTVLPILIAAVVLIGAVVWLLGRPLPQSAAVPAAVPDPQIAQGIAELRAGQARLEGLNTRVAALEGTAQRLAALESRPAPAAPDLAPLREAAAAAAGRAEAAERQIATVERQAATLEERIAAVARDLAGRPAVDPNAFAPRSALEQLSGRVESAMRDAQAAGAQAQQRQAAAEGAIAGFAGRVAANETALSARTQALEAQAARIAALEAQIAQRTQAMEQQASRLAALEGQAQRLAALEGRSARMAALDTARAALEAGRPIGRLPDAPEALARFAATPPPTEAALRLSFDEAARAGRAASEPPAGTGVLDSAVSRLSGLVTVRRGEEILWGDAAGAEIERARRALEAGDLEGALRFLARLSPPAREAMRGWIGQAEALVAARGALRQMAAG